MSGSENDRIAAAATSRAASDSGSPDFADQALLKRVASGDRAAFEALYCDYHGRLLRFLGRLTRRGDLIDETINDTLWIVWRKAGEFRGLSQVSTWIMGIAFRCLMKALRNGGDEPIELPETDQLQDLMIEQVEVLRERSDWLGQGLRHLPPEQYLTLQLAYYLGHSMEEIAEIMACPVSTVKARMFHARVKLRNLLPLIGGIDERRAS